VLRETVHRLIESEGADPAELLRLVYEIGGLRLVDALRTCVSVEQDRLMAEAEPVAEQFWREHRHVREHEPPSQHGRYGLRIERRAAGLSIKWYEFVFFGPKNARRVSHKTVPRGPGARYKLSAFPKAQVWERMVIDGAEERFASIRTRASVLAKAMQVVGNFERHGPGTDEDQSFELPDVPTANAD